MPVYHATSLREQYAMTVAVSMSCDCGTIYYGFYVDRHESRLCLNSHPIQRVAIRCRQWAGEAAMASRVSEQSFRRGAPPRRRRSALVTRGTDSATRGAVPRGSPPPWSIHARPGCSVGGRRKAARGIGTDQNVGVEGPAPFNSGPIQDARRAFEACIRTAKFMLTMAPPFC